MLQAGWLAAWVAAAAAAAAAVRTTTTTAMTTKTSSSAPHELGSIAIFTPPRDQNWTDPSTLYARIVQLPDNALLATWENYSPPPDPVYFPIYQSVDGGDSWTERSRVSDTARGIGLRYQPFLYILPQKLGDFAKGTLLLAGSAIPADLSSTHLELYASRDSGLTWEFVSHVADGGEARPVNGLTPVWEPFLLVHDDKLVYYYADQRDARYGQKLVHQTSADLKTWSGVVEDVTDPVYTARPGMPVIARLPNGQYLYVYEHGGARNPNNTGSYSFPLYYRLSPDPERMLDAPSRLLQATDGSVPTGSPFVVWSRHGGANGTIVVSSGGASDVLVNTALGAEHAWVRLSVPEPRSYSRSLMVFQRDEQYVMLAGGGILPPAKNMNRVTASVVKL